MYEKDAEIYNFCLFGQLTPPSVENLNLSTSIHRLPLSFDILKSQSEVLSIKVPQNATDQLDLDWRVIGLNVSYLSRGNRCKPPNQQCFTT